MSTIINIESYYATRPVTPSPAPRAATADGSPIARAPAGGGADRVEFSALAATLADLSDAVTESSFRLARVAAIRSEIARGTYETRERIDATVERLLDVVG
ncbi:MAG: flagellar biosynthesis anti-sigma factor FlgM [Phycisphaerae bacterium]